VKETVMKALWDHLTANLRAFGREWAKARRHMLDDKQRNMNQWRRARKSAPSAWPGQTQPHNRESRFRVCGTIPGGRPRASGNGH
jgi:hypothetical protein